jgi:hypothetical protein
MESYTPPMKVRVTLPDCLFEAAEHLASRLGVSRERLYADAIRRYIEEHDGPEVTQLLNRVYGPSGEKSVLDPLLVELQIQTLMSGK